MVFGHELAMVDHELFDFLVQGLVSVTFDHVFKVAVSAANKRLLGASAFLLDILDDKFLVVFLKLQVLLAIADKTHTTRLGRSHRESLTVAVGAFLGVLGRSRPGFISLASLAGGRLASLRGLPSRALIHIGRLAPNALVLVVRNHLLRAPVLKGI